MEVITLAYPCHGKIHWDREEGGNCHTDARKFCWKVHKIVFLPVKEPYPTQDPPGCPRLALNWIVFTSDSSCPSVAPAWSTWPAFWKHPWRHWEASTSPLSWLLTQKQGFIAGTGAQFPAGQQPGACFLQVTNIPELSLCCHSSLRRFAADTMWQTPLSWLSSLVPSENRPGDMGLRCLCASMCVRLCAHSCVCFMLYIEENKIIYVLIIMCSLSKIFSALIYCSL